MAWDDKSMRGVVTIKVFSEENIVLQVEQNHLLDFDNGDL